MILENIEQQSAWNIRPDWHAYRRNGISAFVRLKNEAEYCIAALKSIYKWVDEIVIALQGDQDDGTDHLVAKWALDCPKARVFAYPFDSVPNGPGHDAQPAGSVHERAYFYNWTLAKTTCSHALKWDGDMVALDGIEPEIRRGQSCIAAYMHGVEIAGPDYEMSVHPFTSSEPRLFLVTPETYYVTGSHCERLARSYIADRVWRIRDPAFLHFKWAKDHRSATKAWPHDHENIDHFRRLLERRKSGGAKWAGPIPGVLR